MALTRIETGTVQRGCGGCGASRSQTATATKHGSGLQAYQIFDLGGTLEENCRRFGELLGLSEPVPTHVFEAAANDVAYLHELMAARAVPMFLQRLLSKPPAPAIKKNAKKPSTATLLNRASKALLHWGASGFAVVDETTLARRLQACLGCPNLVEPPKSAAYAVATNGTSDAITGGKICSQCGCVVARKARMASETCPMLDPTTPGMSRWNEPMQSRAHGEAE